MIPFQERPTCTIEVGAEATGLTMTRLRQLIAEGDIETVKAGRQRLIVVPSLLRLLESFAAEPTARQMIDGEARS
jgi:hypothetical protein